MELSIVVPTYNEIENVRILIPQIAGVFGDIDHEIVVVDDRSPDGTGQEVERLALRGYPVRLVSKETKEGIGAALRVGYNESRGRVIASTDADLSFDAKDLKRLYQQVLDGSDLVVGNRHAPDSFYETPNFAIRLKHWVSTSGNRAVRTLTRIPLDDYSANFRMIRQAVWRQIQTEDKTNFLLFEMILKTWIKGYHVSGLPVSFVDRRYGKSKLRLSTEVPKFLIKLLKHTYRYRRMLFGPREIRSGRAAARVSA